MNWHFSKEDFQTPTDTWNAAPHPSASGTQIQTTPSYPLTHQNGWTEQDKKQQCWWGCGEKGTLCTVGGMQTGAATVENRWRLLKKLKIELPYDPVMPLLGNYAMNMKKLIWKDTCISMFTATLFIIAKIWKQTKYTIDEWIKMLYIHNGILLSHTK